ncbi:hypothetical protein LT493_15480 [Streptomyces tricolor]|nr:hypothetical protein [Streptomyces tricolor]
MLSEVAGALGAGFDLAGGPLLRVSTLVPAGRRRPACAVAGRTPPGGGRRVLAAPPGRTWTPPTARVTASQARPRRQEHLVPGLGPAARRTHRGRRVRRRTRPLDRPGRRPHAAGRPPRGREHRRRRGEPDRRTRRRGDPPAAPGRAGGVLHPCQRRPAVARSAGYWPAGPAGTGWR